VESHLACIIDPPRRHWWIHHACFGNHALCVLLTLHIRRGHLRLLLFPLCILYKPSSALADPTSARVVTSVCNRESNSLCYKGLPSGASCQGWLYLWAFTTVTFPVRSAVVTLCALPRYLSIFKVIPSCINVTLCFEWNTLWINKTSVCRMERIPDLVWLCFPFIDFITHTYRL